MPRTGVLLAAGLVAAVVVAAFVLPVPGTTAAVAFGDTLTGTTPPALLAVYAVCAVVGATGLWFAIRRRTTSGPPGDPEQRP